MPPMFHTASYKLEPLGMLSGGRMLLPPIPVDHESQCDSWETLSSKAVALRSSAPKQHRHHRLCPGVSSSSGLALRWDPALSYACSLVRGLGLLGWAAPQALLFPCSPLGYC